MQDPNYHVGDGYRVEAHSKAKMKTLLSGTSTVLYSKRAFRSIDSPIEIAYILVESAVSFILDFVREVVSE